FPAAVDADLGADRARGVLVVLADANVVARRLRRISAHRGSLAWPVDAHSAERRLRDRLQRVVPRSALGRIPRARAAAWRIAGTSRSFRRRRAHARTRVERGLSRDWL